MSDKFTEIEELFDVAEKKSQKNIQEYKDKKLEKLQKKERRELTATEFNVVSMYESFEQVLEIFKDSLDMSKNLQKKIYEDMMVFEEEINPEMIDSFSTLQKNVTDSLKTVTNSFKLLTEAKKNLEKEEPKGPSGTMNIENAQIVMPLVGVNTRELLEKFKNRDMNRDIL